MKHSDYYAVVTGASSGIGAELARRFAREGFSLVLVARRQDRLRELSEELADTMAPGGKCEIMPTDLGDLNACRALMDKLVQMPVAVFVNNAGFGDCGSFAETDPEKDLAMIDVNVKAVHYCTKRILQKFKRCGRGYILNVASSAGLIPAGPFMATYYATKSYVVSLTRAIARELQEEGCPVYVGCLCPGPVDTEFNERANVEFALKGISAERCANYAVDMMKKRRVVIIPTLTLKTLLFGGRFIPQSMYIAGVSGQQKKKLSHF